MNQKPFFSEGHIYHLPAVDPFHVSPDLGLERGLMISESDAIHAVSAELVDFGWNIHQFPFGQGKGPDIVATRQGHRLVVEAKGGTSEDPRTRRFGKPFTDAQAHDHVGRCIIQGIQRQTQWPDAEIALAFPLEYFHVKHLLRAREGIRRLGFRVWLLSERSQLRELY